MALLENKNGHGTQYVRGRCCRKGCASGDVPKAATLLIRIMICFSQAHAGTARRNNVTSATCDHSTAMSYQTQNQSPADVFRSVGSQSMAKVVSLSSLHLVKNEDKSVDRMEKTCHSGKPVKCSIGGWVLSKFNVSFSHNHGTTFLCPSTEVAVQTYRSVDAINPGLCYTLWHSVS